MIIIELPNPDTIWDKYKKMFGMKVWNDYYKEYNNFRMYKVSELIKYGKLIGEVQFLPAFLDNRVRKHSYYWHTMLLEIKI